MLASGLLLPGTAANAETLLWSEEFDSTPAPDSALWSYELGDGCDAGICGWGNNELQEYTSAAANVRVEGGHLILTALKETLNGPGDPGPDAYAFTSARIKRKG